MISNHKEILRAFLESYENNKMDIPFTAGLAALSRWIYEKELLFYMREGKINPLSYKSIDVEVRVVWKEMKKEDMKCTSNKGIRGH